MQSDQNVVLKVTQEEESSTQAKEEGHRGEHGGSQARSDEPAQRQARGKHDDRTAEHDRQ